MRQRHTSNIFASGSDSIQQNNLFRSRKKHELAEELATAVFVINMSIAKSWSNLLNHFNAPLYSLAVTNNFPLISSLS